MKRKAESQIRKPLPSFLSRLLESLKANRENDLLKQKREAKDFGWSFDPRPAVELDISLFDVLKNLDILDIVVDKLQANANNNDFVSNLKSLVSDDLKLNGDFIFDEKLLEALSYNILIRNIPANFGNIDISNLNLTTHEDLVDLITSKINIKDLLEAFPYIPIFNFPRYVLSNLGGSFFKNNYKDEIFKQNLELICKYFILTSQLSYKTYVSNFTYNAYESDYCESLSSIAEMDMAEEYIDWGEFLQLVTIGEDIKNFDNLVTDAFYIPGEGKDDDDDNGDDDEDGDDNNDANGDYDDDEHDEVDIERIQRIRESAEAAANAFVGKFLTSENVESLLTSQISKNGCYCLNEDVRFPFSNLFIDDDSLSLKSDADEQLLLHLAFNQTVKLNKIQFGIPSDSTCPKDIKIFHNKNNLGFSDATDSQATQTAILLPVAGQSSVTINLQAVKWQRVDSITVFIENNHGADVSMLHNVKIYGTLINNNSNSAVSNNKENQFRDFLKNIAF